MMIRLLAIAAVLALVACGKVGSPAQPGPASAETYPHTYPSY